ncbi:hypothetical protein [Pseudorhodobacter turbinis]|nr:hypothetical protein [Pseudorhodobacter turbinis]
MTNETNAADIKAKAALEVLEQAYAYFDAETEITCETPEYCEYLTAA